MPIASADVLRVVLTFADAAPNLPLPVSRVNGLILILIALSVLVLTGVMWALMRTARRVSRGPRTPVNPPSPTRKTPDAWFEAGRRMPVPPDPSAPGAAANPGKDDPS